MFAGQRKNEILRGVPEMKSSLLCARLLRTSALGVSLAVAVGAVPAFAQDSEADTQDAAPQESAADASNVITATAQGRAPALSDVPVSLSAVDRKSDV